MVYANESEAIKNWLIPDKRFPWLFETYSINENLPKEFKGRKGNGKWKLAEGSKNQV